MEARPYFRPTTYEPEAPRSHDAEAASRAAVEREMAGNRALGRPRTAKVELPSIREPELPKDFDAQVAQLNDAVMARGVPINKEQLLSLGRERFEELLAAERDLRSLQRVIGTKTDLTNWSSVQRALSAYEASTVPARTATEQLANSEKEREAARQIADWQDLWKFTGERKEVVDGIYNFHDAFGSLLFGQSMLEQLSLDGRIRNHFFCGGKGSKVDLFADWLSVLEGSFTSVKVAQALWHIVSWLCDEQADPPDLSDLARDYFNVRSPSTKQVQLAQAVFDGFLLGYRDWPLWEYAGRRTRTVPDQGRLSAWRKELSRRFLAVTDFHACTRAAFYRDVGYGYNARREFESVRCRAFVDQTVQKLLNDAAALLALGTEESFPDAVLARFQGSVLVSGKHKTQASIIRPLAMAFPGMTVELQLEVV